MEGGGVVVVPVDEKEGRRIAIRPMLSERLTKMWVGVWGLGFGVWGLGFGVWGLGFGVWGLGIGDWGCNTCILIHVHALTCIHTHK